VKVVALDYGSARTGIAVSDPTGTLARPVGVVERVGTEAGLEQLVRLIASEGAGRVGDQHDSTAGCRYPSSAGSRPR